MAKRKRKLAESPNLIGSSSFTSAEDATDRRTRKARKSGSLSRRESLTPNDGALEYTSVTAPDDDSGLDLTADSDTKIGPIKRHHVLDHVKAAPPAFPRSTYDGWKSLLPAVSEITALTELGVVLRHQHAQMGEQPDHNFVTLEDFSIYRPQSDVRRPSELAGLEKLQVHRGAVVGLVFDGTLRVGESKRFVRGVHFKIATVDGYGDDATTDLRDRICIQSTLARSRKVWYQLGRPAPEYRRFYKPFIWLAEFTKHFVDYLLEMDRVTLDDFRFCFHDWLMARHSNKPHFGQWLAQCGELRDFRTTVSAHVDYLWNESCCVDRALRKHPIWGEVDPQRLKAIKEQPNREQRTVVTPFVYEMFKHMYFAEHLATRGVSEHNVKERIRVAKAELGLAPFSSAQDRPGHGALLTPRSQRSTSPTAPLKVNAGDVVCTIPDTQGAWKSSANAWYAYVQAVHVNKDQYTMLDVLWMNEPRDTTLGAAYYPYGNELFLSDNCDCGKTGLSLECVTSKVDVAWYAKDPDRESGLFVRQKHRTIHNEGTYDFVSLQPSDFQCRCSNRHTDFEDCRKRYAIGDTVLVKAADRLDPAQIVDFELESKQVVLRQLLRRKEYDNHDARPNELLLTSKVYRKPPAHVIRKCHIRILSSDVIADDLPTGYDRCGAGDFYYIREEARATNSVADDGILSPPNEGPDLATVPDFQKLVGMGIFCGGGNFDRGLEECGAVDFKYAVDWAESALHSYRANAPESEKLKAFLGSVNDYLAQAMAGKNASYIAMPGGIGLVAAGSPCPGFSNLQRDKSSDASLRNASMVASVVSYVDFFCPRYCFLENVVNMASAKDKDQNVFAQILAAFVAMGYQVQQFLMDSWSHGSSQSRSRIFIVATAPGLEPLPLPQLTHDHPEGAGFVQKALGKASNGKPFGFRRNEYTSFECTTAAQATADLPDIGDGQCRVCPSFPSHYMPSDEDAQSRERIASVPIRPYGMSLAEGVRQGLVSGEPADFLARSSSVRRGLSSKSYSRVAPGSLIPACTTSLRIQCGFTGRTIHWNQDRSLTVMELRRAMGFLDHEVIIGSPQQQVKIVGNSVDRKVSFALGLCLRESWSMSEASKLPDLIENTTIGLVSPADTDAESDTVQETPSPFRAFRDTLRAGASAARDLEPSEKRALRHLDDEAGQLPVKGQGM